MRTTVRWSDEAQRFQIVEVIDDEACIVRVITEMAEGTTNEQACAAYDEWRKAN